MENNKPGLQSNESNPVASAQVAPTIPAATPQAAATNPIPTAPDAKGGSKKMIIILIVILVILAIAGGVYYFLGRQQAPAQQQTTTTGTTQPAITQSDTLDQELDGIDVSVKQDDFRDIDTDLQKL